MEKKELKQCSKCGEWKTLDCFNKRKDTKNGIRADCRNCKNKYNNKYYDEHRDYLLEQKREYGVLHREEKKIYNKQYYENNTPEILKQKQEYYEEHKDELLKQKRNFYEEHKDELLKQKQEYYENNKPEIRKKQNKHHGSPIKFNSKAKFRKEIEIYEEVRKSKDGYLECKCAYCGDWFKPFLRNVRNRIKSVNNINQGEGRLYCSEACKQACPVYKKILYSEGQAISTSREVQPELRQMVLARDNYTCQRCNKTKEELSELGIQLHCHHLEGIHWEPLMSADVDMCITYCQPCHVKAHQTPDCGYHDQRCVDIYKE